MELQSKRKIFLTLLTNVCRMALAAVLLVSGFVKAVDPMGAMYKLQEYVSSFELDILSGDWLLFVAIVQAAVEFLVGAFLLMGVYRKPMSVLAFLMFLFFTPFTLYIALNDPVADCGCFGEAMVLTNKQTFFKNALLLLFATVVFIGRKLFVCNLSSRNRWIMVIFSILYISLVEGLSLSHIPVLDFRPYAVGNDLRAMVNGADEMYNLQLLVEQDGVEHESEADTVPDESWLMADSRPEFVDKPIGDFSILDWYSDYDVADDILADTGYVCVVAIELVEEAEVSRVDRLNDFYDYCLEKSVPFYAATASGEDEIELWRKRTGAEYPIYWADASLLRTMVRANPGVLLFKDGVIVGKWNVSDLPDTELLSASPTGMPDKIVTLADRMRGWLFWTLAFFAPVVLIIMFDLVTGRPGRARRRNAAADDIPIPSQEINIEK